MNDAMYKRALEGKGVYGVQLFDFSRKQSASSAQSLEADSILWGGGYWVPAENARIDPNIQKASDYSDIPEYSTTHSVAIFALDVRTNKTPWPKGTQTHGTTTADHANNNSNQCSNSTASSINPPMLDFLGKHQWEWFQSALANSHAAVNIIVSGLQIHPERFPNDGNVIEEWSKFPQSRQMLYDMILDSGVRSPLLISGDVHMSEIMRRDCIRSSDIVAGGALEADTQRRPLVEVTTSGMTHSWGTSFSSQPRNHRLPLKLYTYLVSPIFMTICHWVNPWNDIMVRYADDIGTENKEQSDRQGNDDGGKMGLQYYLGHNFAELEFDFKDKEQDASINNGGGAVTVRIFGKEASAPPKLQMKWTFDQLSGNSNLPGSTPSTQDFLTLNEKSQTGDEWVCVPHRGLANKYHGYAANTIMFFTFCFLFFSPHAIIVWVLMWAKRMWVQRRNVVHKWDLMRTLTDSNISEIVDSTGQILLACNLEL